jgi:putative N6-adenine-specific DNA methylase
MNRYLLSVPTLFGLESLAANEIRLLGYTTERVEDGRISFYGDERAICKANIWLRYAERVQIKLGDFEAVSFRELFERTKALQWPDILPPDAAFPVSGHCLSSKLGSVPDCQSIIKKAAVESMKTRWTVDRVDESGPLYRINFNIIRDRAAIYIDTSGDSLHKRGYRVNPGVTPIRETLAAGLVALSGWRPGKALWDPFCGGGTIAIEAAMLAANRAPGLTRAFAAESWEAVTAGAASSVQAANAGARQDDNICNFSYKRLFDEERSAARDAFIKKLKGSAAGGGAIEIAGSDLSRQCVRAARQNAAAAGVSSLIRFFQMDAKDMDRDHIRLRELGVCFPERGCVVTNPPYGERRDDLPEARDTCVEWSSSLNRFKDWGWCIISAMDDFERVIGRTAAKRRKLNNGKLKCKAYLYWN